MKIIQIASAAAERQYSEIGSKMDLKWPVFAVYWCYINSVQGM